MVPFFLFYSITYADDQPTVTCALKRTFRTDFKRNKKQQHSLLLKARNGVTSVTTAVWFHRSRKCVYILYFHRLALLQKLQSNLLYHLSHFLMNSRMRSISMGTMTNFVFSNLFFYICDPLSFIPGVLVSARVPGRPLHRLQRRPLLPVPLWDKRRVLQEW
jgi:hypothetical protein